MAPHFMLANRFWIMSLLLLNGLLVIGKTFTCNQSVAPVTRYRLKSTPKPPLTSMAPSRIPSAINMTPSPPVQPFSPDGPPATNELACKSEPGEKTFAFCVADSCKGTATCEGCNSDFGIITKVKCMSYNIQKQQNFCQDINGIKFLCVGACVARTGELIVSSFSLLSTSFPKSIVIPPGQAGSTHQSDLQLFTLFGQKSDVNIEFYPKACSTCEYDNVAKTKAFQPPWDGQVFMSPALIAKSKASPYPYPPIWIIPTLFALKYFKVYVVLNFNYPKMDSNQTPPPPQIATKDQENFRS
ncbi:hypothetical protein PSHT_05732 [Puccinia striiformis]|uniref:Uncharacterized protein n=1 Tax=Puccinia striiformis TaxID=27350 RepID=A0A2S4W9R1_9BASI|nr:hypothetical protein PSHT_05732 [Puccinia striiformis]